MQSRFRSPFLAVLACLGLAGCASDPPSDGSTDKQSAPDTAPPKTAAPPTAAAPLPATMTHTLNGTIESIRFQNINKAAGRFAYNIELTVRVESVDPTPALWRSDNTPHKVQVRVAQSRGWSGLPADEQAALAPDGPKPQLFPERWREYVTGESIELTVRFTSTDLAHLEP